MRRVAGIALIAVLLCGCGGNVSTRVDELQKKSDDLSARVKTLENDLLEAQKKAIQHEDALRQMNERLKDMQANVDKLQLAATTVR